MDITFQAIHVSVSDSEKAYFEKKVQKLERFHDGILRAEVFFKEIPNSGKTRKELEVKMLVPGSTLVASDSGTTFQEATDLLIEKLKTQLKKHKSIHG